MKRIWQTHLKLEQRILCPNDLPAKQLSLRTNLDSQEVKLILALRYTRGGVQRRGGKSISLISTLLEHVLKRQSISCLVHGRPYKNFQRDGWTYKLLHITFSILWLTMYSFKHLKNTSLNYFGIDFSTFEY